MKTTKLFTYLFLITIFFNMQIYSQIVSHKKNITIRSDRVFMLNGQPFSL